MQLNPILETDEIELFISKRATLKMLKHCKDFKHLKLEVMGFMVGHRFSWEDKEYTVVKDVVTSDLDTSSVSVKFASFEPLFEEMEKLEEEGKDYILAGWYHSHPGHTSFMSPTDKDTQKRMFKKEFQSAVVIDPINMEMKAFTLRDDEVYEKPYAVIEGPDDLVDIIGEEALEELEEAPAEIEEAMVEREMVEGEMVEEEMVEEWEEEEEEEEEEGEEVPEGPGGEREDRLVRDPDAAYAEQGKTPGFIPPPAPETGTNVEPPGTPPPPYAHPDEPGPVPDIEFDDEKTEVPGKDLEPLDYAWIAAPLLLGVLGGIFGYFALNEKKKNWSYMLLILGGVLSIFWYSFSYLYY